MALQVCTGESDALWEEWSFQLADGVLHARGHGELPLGGVHRVAC